MPRNHVHEIMVGALLLGGFGVLAFLAIQVGAFKVDTNTVRLHGSFENVAGLSDGALVAVAGVEVGRVDGLEVAEGRARVTVVVDRKIQVHDDAILRMRARSVLGEKYLELVPGSASARVLEDGDAILATEGQVEIDQMVTEMGPLLQAADPEALSKALEAVAQSLAQDPQRLERMLGDTEVLLHNLRVASEDAPALVAEVRATVKDTRATLARVGPAVDRVEAVLTELESVTGPLGEASADLPVLVDEARGAVGDARTLMSHLDASTDDLSTVLDNLSAIDRWEVRRLLREEGVLVRLRPSEVVPDEANGEAPVSRAP